MSALSILAQFCRGEDEHRKEEVAAHGLNDYNYHPDEEQTLPVASGGERLQQSNLASNEMVYSLRT